MAEPMQRAVYRISRQDFSRSTYYGYPPIVDQFPPFSRIVDLTEGRRLSFVLAGARLKNSVLHTDNLAGANYVVRDGPPDAEDFSLRSKGFPMIYDGTPKSLYPKTERPWRIYRAN